MLSSLELRWLKPPKDLRLPLIVHCEMDWWGLQHHAEKGEVLIGTTYYPLDTGILQINPHSPMDLTAIMVHEFRHHWQHKNGWKYDGVDPNPIAEQFRKQGVVFPEWEAMCEYFARSRSEMDALLYQHKNRPEMYSTEYLMPHFRKRRRDL